MSYSYYQSYPSPYLVNHQQIPAPPPPLPYNSILPSTLPPPPLSLYGTDPMIMMKTIGSPQYYTPQQASGPPPLPLHHVPPPLPHHLPQTDLTLPVTVHSSVMYTSPAPQLQQPLQQQQQVQGQGKYYQMTKSNKGYHSYSTANRNNSGQRCYYNQNQYNNNNQNANHQRNYHNQSDHNKTKWSTTNSPDQATHLHKSYQDDNMQQFGKNSLKPPKVEIFEPVSRVYRAAVILDLALEDDSQSQPLQSSYSVLVRYVDDRVANKSQQSSNSEELKQQQLDDILEEYVPSWCVKGLKEQFIVDTEAEPDRNAQQQPLSEEQGNYSQQSSPQTPVSPAVLTMSTFTVNDAVHVRAGCANTGAWLWWEATVTKIHLDQSTGIPAYYSVRFPPVQMLDENGIVITLDQQQGASQQLDQPQEDEEEIIEASRIRSADCHYDLPLAKEKWTISEETSNAILEHVTSSYPDNAIKRNLHTIANAVGLCALTMDQQDTLILEAIGMKGTLENAKLALEILYFRNAKEMARLQGLRKMLETKLELVKQKKECGYRLIFNVDNDIIGSCIGRGGVNLKKVHRLPGVIAININDIGTSHEIEIYAESEPLAQQAREAFEHVRARIYITREEIGPVIGRRGVHLRDIERKSGVSKFFLIENHVDDQGNVSPPYFETVGTRTGIEIATKLLNLHRTALAQQRKLEENVRKARADLLQVGSTGTVSPQELHSLSSRPSAATTAQAVSVISPPHLETLSNVTGSSTPSALSTPNVTESWSKTDVVEQDIILADEQVVVTTDLEVDKEVSARPGTPEGPKLKSHQGGFNMEQKDELKDRSKPNSIQEPESQTGSPSAQQHQQKKKKKKDVGKAKDINASIKSTTKKTSANLNPTKRTKKTNTTATPSASPEPIVTVPPALSAGSTPSVSAANVTTPGTITSLVATATNSIKKKKLASKGSSATASTSSSISTVSGGNSSVTASKKTTSQHAQTQKKPE